MGFGAHSINSECDQIKLHKLYVHPRKQRLGIGHRIVKYIANQRREEAFKTITLAVNKRNSNAIAAYRKYGFTHRESVVVDIGHGYQMDDYILELPLVPYSVCSTLTRRNCFPLKASTGESAIIRTRS